jgi:hypothetical protein
VTFAPQFQVAGSPVRVVFREQRARISVGNKFADIERTKNVKSMSITKSLT